MVQQKIQKNNSFYGLIFTSSLLILELLLCLILDYSFRMHLLFVISIGAVYIAWLLLKNLE